MRVALAILLGVVATVEGGPCLSGQGEAGCPTQKTSENLLMLQMPMQKAIAEAGAYIAHQDPKDAHVGVLQKDTDAGGLGQPAGGFIYGVYYGRIFKQALSTGQAPSTSRWFPASGPKVTSIAIGGDKIYGVGPPIRRKYGVYYGRIWQQDLSAMTPRSRWTPASVGFVTSIAIGGDKIYGVGPDRRIWQQDLSAMTPRSRWTRASVGTVTSIAIGGDKIYGVDPRRRIWQQDLSAMATSSRWSGPINNGPVIAIAIKGDTMYVVGPDRRIRRQVLSRVGSSSAMAWPPASRGPPVTSIAFSN